MWYDNPVMDEYIERIRKLVLARLGSEPVKIVVFGSVARGENDHSSDVDVGIFPKEGRIDRVKVALLREELDESTIPYRVEIVLMNEVPEKLARQAESEGLVWKE